MSYLHAKKKYIIFLLLHREDNLWILEGKEEYFSKINIIIYSGEETNQVVRM